MIIQPYTYMQALEDQLRGISGLKKVLSVSHVATQELVPAFKKDLYILQHAEPFAWFDMPVQAVLEASKTIPLDTHLNVWNMPVNVFWHFETPLPVRTLNPDSNDPGIKGLTITLFKHRDSGTGKIHDWFHVVTWFDPPVAGFSPSTSFDWPMDETIEEAVETARREHYDLYDRPGAQFEKVSHSSPEITMEAVTRLSQFIVAGHIWLNQKVLLTGEGHIERHRRKDFNRQTGQSLTHIRVVDLRKVERVQDDAEPGESGRTYSHRWVVSGHWRQQPCGPQLSQRKLTYVIPHLKGPEGAPLLEHKSVIYKVDR